MFEYLDRIVLALPMDWYLVQPGPKTPMYLYRTYDDALVYKGTAAQVEAFIEGVQYCLTAQATY